MSMPVGQSRAQPLQDRQRSSACSTAGSSQPSTTSPSTISWSTRARPRVESFSSRVATYDGHITPPDAGVVGQALADAGAPVDRGRERPVVVGEPQHRQHRAPGRRQPQVGVERRRVDQHAGVEQPVRVEQPLGLPDQVDGLARSTSAAAAPSGPGRHRARPTCCRRTTRPGRRRPRRSARKRRRPSRVVEREVDPHVHAAVAEVAVGHAVEPVLAQQRVEVAQVVAEPVRRHGGVLPARTAPGRSSERAASPAPSSRIRHSTACSAGSVTIRCGDARRRARPPAPATRTSAARAAGDLGEQPARRPAAGRAPGRRGSGPLDDPVVEALARDQRVLAAGPARRRPRRPWTGSRAPPARGAGASSTRVTSASSTTASVPSEPTRNRSKPAPVLGQQVLEGVAGDLPAEPAELGADRARGARRPGRRAAASVAGARSSRSRPLPVGERHRQRRPRCRRCVRSRAPGSRRRCCRSSRRWCSGCASTGRARSAARAAAASLLQGGVHHPGLHHAPSARSGSTAEHLVELPAGVDHDARPDRVAGDRGAGAAHGQRGPGRRARRRGWRAPRRRRAGRTTTCGGIR